MEPIGRLVFRGSRCLFTALNHWRVDGPSSIEHWIVSNTAPSDSLFFLLIVS